MIVFNLHCCKNDAISMVTHLSHIPELFSKVIVQFVAVIKNVVDFRFLCVLWESVILQRFNFCLSEEFKRYRCDFNSYYPNYQ